MTDLGQVIAYAHLNRHHKFVDVFCDVTITRHCDTSPIYQLLFREAKENEKPNAWGWQDTGSPNTVMIANDWGCFSIQFPYGPQVEEKTGRGKIVHLILVSSQLFSDS